MTIAVGAGRENKKKKDQSVVRKRKYSYLIERQRHVLTHTHEATLVSLSHTAKCISTKKEMLE